MQKGNIEEHKQSNKEKNSHKDGGIYYWIDEGGSSWCNFVTLGAYNINIGNRGLQRARTQITMDRRLYIAASKGQFDFLRQHTDQLEIQTTTNRNTALHVAAQFGQLECVAAILEVCPSLLRGGNIRGETPLHLAASKGYTDIVKALIVCAKKR